MGGFSFLLCFVLFLIYRFWHSESGHLKLLNILFVDTDRSGLPLLKLQGQFLKLTYWLRNRILSSILITEFQINPSDSI